MIRIIKMALMVSVLLVSVPGYSADMFNIFGNEPAPEIAKPAPAVESKIPAPQFLFENPSDQQVMKELMDLVVRDLQLCLTSLDGKGKSYLNGFPALGHINHAEITLCRIHPPKPFNKVVYEIQKRLFCAKFYVLMYNYDEVKSRVTSLIEYIGTLG